MSLETIYVLCSNNGKEHFNPNGAINIRISTLVLTGVNDTRNILFVGKKLFSINNSKLHGVVSIPNIYLVIMH